MELTEVDKAIDSLLRARTMATRAIRALQDDGADSYLIALASAQIARESSLDALIEIKHHKDKIQ